MKPQMIQSAYDRLALSDGDSSQNYYRHAGPDMRLKLLLSLAAKIKPRKILEVGCSDGHVMESLKSLLVKGQETHLFGLDISHISLQRAQAKNCGDVIMALAEKLPIRQGSIDLIIASQVLEHIPDLEGAIDQAFSALQPGGHFMITVPLADWFKLYKGLIRRAPVKFLDQETHIREWALAPFQRFVSNGRLLSQLIKSGFTIRQCQGSFFYSWRLERLADRVLLKCPQAYNLLRAWDVILGTIPVLLWGARYAIIVSQKPEIIV
ncbi:class I SAM-dependent methyltransferase [candidate division TA06 bacterium]|uniref:Class I SAM-dependent methyltransferase n=1 Tax=candidate division TA06 bacterium TaxID=2250710 RepID=A0A933IDD3_UNCT6|nr:class I SAM-dependent methyltransferase [candidate division TA06 bacterium]